MNIFFLDKNPKICAQYHADKHVVKMILESAQILSTVINEKAGKQVTPYKSTHINHPCVVWTGESLNNWNYVYELMLALEKEWQFRWGHNKRHEAVQKTKFAGITFQALEYLFINIPFSEPALVMPDEFKTDNAVESYRNYYNFGKTHLHKWTRREIPSWIISEDSDGNFQRT